jgi:PAS domain S-box-containing protein
MPTRALMRVQPLHDQAGTAAPHRFSSRHFLKLIEDTGEVGFWSADLHAERMEASVGLSRLLGLDPVCPVTFGLFLGMIHPEDQAVHGDQVSMLRGGQAVSREFRIVRPDRTQRWIRHQAEVIVGPDGRPSQAMGVVFDVTTRYAAIRSVIERNERLNALIAATAAVFWINTADGEPSDVSQWMALTGQTHAEVAGRGWLDAVHPDDRGRTWAAWGAAVAEAVPYNTEYRLRCADGAYRWFNARGAPVRNPDGSVREWVGVCLAVPDREGDDPTGGAPAPQGGAVAAAGATAARMASTGSISAGTASADSSSTDSSLAGSLRPRRAALTAAQLRAARGMTGLSKEELARRAEVSVSTIVRLEDSQSAIRPRRDTVEAVRRSLEAAGVAFIVDAEGRPGLREA